MVVLIVAATFVVLNREWVYDYYRGMTYTPSNEMDKMKKSLSLTERGEFLFNASQPELEEREEFNDVCRAKMTETAVLGCYTAGNIYVYNIADAELNGIRELTTAHELLHAVWARMSEEEKGELSSALKEALDANQGAFADELEVYDTNERQEELYVRAGTEIKKLPKVLEEHYATIFRDQDKIVDYYDSYIAVFRKLEAGMNNLKNEMAGIESDLNNKTSTYETGMSQLNAKIADFNSCAQTEGCFGSEVEFYSARTALLAEKESLDRMYAEINGLVDVYNAKVEQYNADVVRGEELNQKINSSAKPKEIK